MRLVECASADLDKHKYQNINIDSHIEYLCYKRLKKKRSFLSRSSITSWLPCSELSFIIQEHDPK